MYKYIPGSPEPALSITEVLDGKGITATVKNVGTADATDVEYSIEITGGFIIIPKTGSGNLGVLTPGEEANFSLAPKGIGLGIIFPKPSIALSVECAEGASDDTTRTARIFLSRVTF